VKFVSKVIKYKDNVDTDVIIPARFLNVSDAKELAKHCMEDLDASFHEKLSTRKIIIAGENFGCGSSREHAPLSILSSGVMCVIAKSFARIFYRNSLNIGLPILECADIERADDNDELSVDFLQGKIVNLTKNEEYTAVPFPDFMQKIIEHGGLINYIKTTS